MPRSQRAVRIALLAVAGLLVVLVAGSVSMSQWTRARAPVPEDPTAPPVELVPGATEDSGSGALRESVVPSPR